MTDEIKQLEQDIQATQRMLEEQKKRLNALKVAASDAFPVGSVVGWKVGSVQAAGRVTAVKITDYHTDYTVTRIKQDGTEGERAEVSDWNRDKTVVLLAEEYEEGKKYTKPAPKATIPLKEIATRINAHLKALEADPEYNGNGRDKGRQLYSSGAAVSGGRVRVVYITYQGGTSLTGLEAEAYLNWLDAGNKGAHYEQQRQEAKA